MREIKFRAWDKQSKVMREVEIINFELEEVTCWDWNTHEYIDLSFDEIELIQYTGLNDVNGVEIYTGYIVEYSAIVPSSDPKDGDIGVVKLEDGSFRIKPLEKNYTFLFPNGNIKNPSGFWTVIGNIYENPNLEIK